MKAQPNGGADLRLQGHTPPNHTHQSRDPEVSWDGSPDLIGQIEFRTKDQWPARLETTIGRQPPGLRERVTRGLARENTDVGNNLSSATVSMTRHGTNESSYSPVGISEFPKVNMRLSSSGTL
jgi:hypothetical protein